MALARNGVEQQLSQKLLMELRQGKRADHRYYVLMIDGVKVAQTHVSTGTSYKTLGNDLVSSMARQLYLTAPFFRDIVNCKKSRDDYLQCLKEQERLK